MTPDPLAVTLSGKLDLPFGQLEAADAVDDLFLTISPELVGGQPSPRILEGTLSDPRSKRLTELLECGGELFARYQPRR